jgi:site-specific recombinase XerD
MHIDHETISSFADSLKNSGKQAATIESYCRDARRFITFLREQSIRVEDVEAKTLLDFQHHVQEIEHGKGNSVRRMVIGVRQFFRFLQEQRSIPSTPFDEVSIPHRIESAPSQNVLEKIGEMVQHLLSQFPSGLNRARDNALLALMAVEGVKANEILELHWSDLLPSVSQSTLKIRGLRHRTIELSPTTTAAVLHYRQEFQTDPRLLGDDTGRWARMFISFKGRDSSVPIPTLSRHGLKFIVYELGEKFGMKHLNSELLRHFAVERMLAAGKPPEAIMNHLGLRRIGNIRKHLHSGTSNP